MNNLVCWIAVTTLCASLAFMPAVASDFTLEVFGNANMDETIDVDDVAYVEGIIEGTNEHTELADANHDGKIDENDIAQVEKIINGTQTEITFVDSNNKTVTVKQPLKRLVIYNHQCGELLQLLGVDDRVVGIRETFAEQPNRFPKISKVQSIGSDAEPNIEAVLECKPDAIITYTFYPTEGTIELLSDVGRAHSITQFI